LSGVGNPLIADQTVILMVSPNQGMIDIEQTPRTVFGFYGEPLGRNRP
jgi:hypothetical protein